MHKVSNFTVPLFDLNFGEEEAEAIELLASRKLIVDDLIGACYPLEDHVKAFAEAWDDEQQKIFLLPRGD